jgi:hypothetical protein
MRRGMPSPLLSLFAMAALAVLVGPRHSFAAPLANDNFVDAIQVSPLPFTDSVDLIDATTERGEVSPTAADSRCSERSGTGSASQPRRC